ncbi:MAG: acyl carrier protein [Planctomycetes bacterium]|nr:acyl carrier protein [Planctomycetota bacterium]NBY03033.1 acyl carrier protein [Planctomycetota bacterium]
MNREKIRSTIVDIIENDLGVRHQDLNDEITLRDGLGLDSVDIVSVISQIERQFKIRLSQADLEQISTVGQVLDLIVSRTSDHFKSEAA